MQRILVLFGGTSSEREVSLKSGQAVADGLREIGHIVETHDLQQDSLAHLDLSEYTFVFNALHGGYGENGGLQRELDRAGVTYSGSGPIACRLAMDKELTKAQFLARRVPTAPYTVISKSDSAARIKRSVNRLGLPLVIKPVNEGSSVGVSIVKSAAEVKKAVEEAFQFGERVMLEQYIAGREFTVAIIGARAYPVIEIAPAREFYDYAAKYTDGGTRYILTPELSDLQAKLAQYHAKRAYNSLRCHGYGRVDLMLDADGEFHVLEVNTLPGMTARSLLPQAAAQAGLGFEEALQAMIDASCAPRRTIPLTSEERDAPKQRSAA